MEDFYETSDGGASELERGRRNHTNYSRCGRGRAKVKWKVVVVGIS